MTLPRRTSFGRSVFVLMAVFCLAAVPQLAQARSAPESFADLADKSLPAVVNVATTQTITADSQMQDLDEMLRDFLDKRQGAKPRPRKATSLGSGFIVDPSGIIVTNKHVIDGAFDIKALLEDGSVLSAHLLATSSLIDLAVLKVEVGHPLPSLEWGNSNALRIGDPVLTIGNALGWGRRFPPE